MGSGSGDKSAPTAPTLRGGRCRPSGLEGPLPAFLMKTERRRVAPVSESEPTANAPWWFQTADLALGNLRRSLDRPPRAKGI